jgi:NTP pyrophosphatase (non-canonical NTP hydrolase)
MAGSVGIGVRQSEPLTPFTGGNGHNRPVNDDATIESVRDRLRDFAVARDWGQFHKPKNLAMALAGEVGELLAEMQWLTDDQVHERLADPDTRGDVEEEFADVFLYLVQLADVCGVDLIRVAHAKITRNDGRFPPLETSS